MGEALPLPRRWPRSFNPPLVHVHMLLGLGVSWLVFPSVRCVRNSTGEDSQVTQRSPPPPPHTQAGDALLALVPELHISSAIPGCWGCAGAAASSCPPLEGAMVYPRQDGVAGLCFHVAEAYTKPSSPIFQVSAVAARPLAEP